MGYAIVEVGGKVVVVFCDTFGHRSRHRARGWRRRGADVIATSSMVERVETAAAEVEERGRNSSAR